MIHVTVAKDAETLAELSFDDVNMIVAIGGVSVTCRNVMVGSAGSLWQRVEHAASVAAEREWLLRSIEDS
jgi:hypothetical protein